MVEGYVKDLLPIKLTIYKEGNYAFQKNTTSLPQSAKLTAPSSEGAKVDKKTDAIASVLIFYYSSIVLVSTGGSFFLVVKTSKEIGKNKPTNNETMLKMLVRLSK